MRNLESSRHWKPDTAPACLKYSCATAERRVPRVRRFSLAASLRGISSLWIEAVDFTLLRLQRIVERCEAQPFDVELAILEYHDGAAVPLRADASDPVRLS